MRFDSRTSTGLGKQIWSTWLLVQIKYKTRSQEIGAVSPQETGPDFPVNVQESLVEAWVDSGLLRGPGTEYNSVCTSPFEGHHYHNYPYHSLPQAKNRERTQPRPRTESWIKDLLSMAPPIRIRPSFPHSQSLPLGRASYSKSLFQELPILIHQRADRMKTTITEN